MEQMGIIERIEKVAAALNEAKALGATRIEASIDDVSHPDLLKACEHYGVEPNDSRWYNTAVTFDGVRVNVFGTERTSYEPPRVNAMDLLRADAALTNTQAA